jgi:hypothetical protein
LKRWLVLAAVLLGGSIHAAQLPNAAQVASQIGQAVEFEDSIQAVSKSRTHDGWYLSFGAPYPKQVLTVWIPSGVFAKLPGRHTLIGRTVRISGMLQSTPTGPMLGLESLDQYHALPIDEAVLSQLRIDGRTDRAHFAIALRQLLNREDFATLEALATELHQSKERISDGSWLLETFFEAFHLRPNTSNAYYARRSQNIAHWRERYPQSIAAILCAARFQIDLAWKWRAAAAGKGPEDEAWRNYRQALSDARRLLEEHPEAKASPDYYVEMQAIALGQAWPKTDYFRLFDEAVAREPDYYAFYTSAARFLLPKWYGAKGEWEQFAEEQRQKRGGTDGDALYARIAWSVRLDYGHHLFDKCALSWETVAAGYEALIQQYPDSRFLKNAYAHMAWEARDRERLRAALPAIRGNPDIEVWVNWENVRLAEMFARSAR